MTSVQDEKRNALIAMARPATTVIMVRDRPDGAAAELLMMKRASGMAFAPGAMVFPGGAVDAADVEFARALAPDLEIEDAAARIGAIRELIEETGLAVGLPAAIDAEQVVEARRYLAEGRSFADICTDRNWMPDLSALTPWARWMPPRKLARIFDTRFYLADGGRAVGSMSPDRQESTELLWAAAGELLERERRGELAMIFPTLRNLERLAQYGSHAELCDHARCYPVRLIMPFVTEDGGAKVQHIADGHGYPTLSEPIEPRDDGST